MYIQQALRENCFYAAFFFLLICSYCVYAQTEKPNIILIVADDLGWNDVGFRNPEMATPNLNALKEAGIELQRFYVGALCTPTRAGLLTGKYPDRFGLRNVVGPRAIGGLPLEEQTLADRLGAVGYQHRGAFGKWHLGHSDIKYHPLRRGFTNFYGHYNGAIDYFTHYRYGARDWHEDFKVIEDEGYTTDLVAAKTVAFIKKATCEASPFFAYVALNAPHTPLQAKADDLKLMGFDPHKEMEEYDGGGYQREEFKPDDYGKKGRGNTARQTYSAMVYAMDKAVGEILKVVKELGIEENTIIWFLSDNGGDLDYAGSNLPLRGEKATEWEGGVRSVSVVYWKGRWQGGKGCDQVLGFTDVLPTLVSVAGGQPEPTDGLDVSTALDGNRLADRVYFLGHDAVVMHDWKLNNGQLFNLKDDISESEDVSALYPEILLKLQTALADFKKIVKPFSLQFHPKEWRPTSWAIEE